MTTAQRELYELIAGMDPEDAAAILEFIKRFARNDDVATKDDIAAIRAAEEEFRKGECISLSEYDKARN